jgi:DNA primase
MERDKLIGVLESLGYGDFREGRGNIFISCPWAEEKHASGRDRNPSCSVKIAENEESVFKCFACSEAGSLVRLVGKITRGGNAEMADIYEAVFKAEQFPLEGRIKKALDKINGAEPAEKRSELETWDERELEKYAGRVPKYALDRGLTAETCKAWELGYDMREKRLTFAIRRAGDNALVGIAGRSIVGGEPKYRDYLGFKKEKYLYGENRVETGPEAGRIIVVEGYVKKLLLTQWGFPNVVATMGAIPGESQLAKLRRWGLPVSLAQDGDWAGQRGKERCIEGLHGRVPLYSVAVPEDRDIDEMQPGEARVLIEKAKFLL